LAAGNADYERRFDRVFLIRAAGRSRIEILSELERRLAHSDEQELPIVADELRQIALLRLQGVIES
jgi:2-oxo-4-hydroxy-4-carboxy-5-ureidoimidazoline decarboxylase